MKTKTMTKKDYSKALKEGRVLIVGANYSPKNGWNKFRVYEIKRNKLEEITAKECPYWNEKSLTYKCGAWGTDRRVEIILSIGYAFGLTFSQIQQNYQWVQNN